MEGRSGVLWRAVVSRDGRWDGQFVFAVRSTGVYCRPSCPARRPAPERVVFFRGAEEAERAGFRPCRRCRPSDFDAGDPAVETVRRACRILAAAVPQRLRLGDLAAAVGVKPGRLSRLFRRIAGVSPRQYAESRRLRAFKAQVREGASVAGALYGAGYGSASRLYEGAAARLGMTPAAYRRGGRGARIRYAVAACPLGRLLVAATERGVCAVSLGESAARLAADLRREYPAAEIRRDGASLRRRLAAILAHLGGRAPNLDLPLDVHATAFQWRVWRALRSIPYGRTRTYGEIARRIGRPRAARAVSRACASNRVALAIPCHRAVRSGGGVGGYRWGIARKERLLEREAGRRAL